MTWTCPNCCEPIKVIKKLYIEKEPNKFSNNIIELECSNDLCKISKITIER